MKCKGQYWANFSIMDFTVLGQHPLVWPTVMARHWLVIRLHPGQHWPNTGPILGQCCKAIIRKRTVLGQHWTNSETSFSNIGPTLDSQMFASIGPVQFHCSLLYCHINIYRLRAVDMGYLRSACGVTWRAWWTNEKV